MLAKAEKKKIDAAASGATQTPNGEASEGKNGVVAEGGPAASKTPAPIVAIENPRKRRREREGRSKERSKERSQRGRSQRGKSQRSKDRGALKSKDRKKERKPRRKSKSKK